MGTSGWLNLSPTLKLIDGLLTGSFLISILGN